MVSGIRQIDIVLQIGDFGRMELNCKKNKKCLSMDKHIIAFTIKNAITPPLKPTEAAHLTAPISVVLYVHPTCDASLQETNLEHWQYFIDAAVAECALRLVRHPALAPMYGKPRNMRRSVGFFAKCEDTYGYFSQVNL